MRDKIIANSAQLRLGFFSQKTYSATTFRSLLSKVINVNLSLFQNVNDLGSIFNREADGKLSQHPSAFRFSSEPNWVWLDAIGEKATLTLTQLTTTILNNPEVDLLGLKSPRLENINAGIVLNASEPTVKHCCRQLIVCKNAEQFKLWTDAATEQRQERIAQVVATGLRKQCELLGFDPTNLSNAITPTAVEIIYDWAAPKITSHHTKAYVRVVSTSFDLPSRLTGSWAAGPLINKGFGAISPVLA